MTAAFGQSQRCTQIARVRIQITKDITITEDFIILPTSYDDKRIIFGKPLLHKLRYRLDLDEDNQYLTVDGKEISVKEDNIKYYKHRVVEDDKLQKYIKKFPDIFASDVKSIPIHDFTYKVHLENFDFQISRPFYSNTIQDKQIREFLDDALKNKVLKPINDNSKLIALAPIFPIVQQSGKTRVVTDFRAINKSLVYQPDTIPPVQLLIQKLFPYKIFSSLDLKSAYYNVPLDEEGCSIGITTSYGNYEFLKLPFGLASAPAVFTRFMRYIFEELEFDPKFDFVQCYLDDIIIASIDEEHHRALLEKVFKLLEKYGLRLTVKKVKLFQHSIEFLGYVIKNGRRYPSEKKTEAIDKWLLPKNAKEWYSFIGFVNYLNCFIPNGALLLKPMYTHHAFIAKKGNLPENSPVASTLLQENFKKIKEAIKATVGLQLFDPKEEIFIMTDASDLGVGGMILQKFSKNPEKLVPITFFSKGFNSTQQRYSTLERELLGILLALNHNYLLLSSKITVLTDHQALVSFSRKTSMLNTRMLRFIETLSTFPLTIKYIPGTKNHADFLSRFYVQKQPVLSTNDFRPNIIDIDFKAIQTTFPIMNDITDDDLEKLKENLLNKTNEDLPQHIEDIRKDFVVIDDMLYFKLENQLFQIVTFDECQEYFEEMHNKYHGSPIVLLDLLAENGWFHPQRVVIARDTVKLCSNCDMFTSFNELPAPYQAYKTPNLGEIWHIDFVGPLNAVTVTENGTETTRYIIVAVEYVTGYCVALPTTNMSSSTVKKFLLHLLTYFPIVTGMVSDNAQNFMSREIKEFVKEFKLNWQYVSKYYPQSNSRVERVNGILKKIMKPLDPSFNKWPLFIFQVIATYNNTTTIFDTSPAKLFFGLTTNKSIDCKAVEKLIKEVYRSNPFNVYETDAIILRMIQLETLDQHREEISDKKNVARKNLKLLNDPRFNHNAYTLGEFVFAKKFNKRLKTDPNYDGPFTVAKILDKNTYKLRDLHDRLLPFTYNLSHLRPCFQYYGSPFRSIGDFTQVFGDHQRKTFINTFHSPEHTDE